MQDYYETFNEWNITKYPDSHFLILELSLENVLTKYNFELSDLVSDSTNRLTLASI